MIETRPDIVSKLNDLNRSEKERERKEKEKSDNGEWQYHGESGEWMWTGESEAPDYNDDLLYEQLTEEEMKQAHADERKLYEEMEIQRKKEQREKRQQKQREIRDAMKVPINPLPEREMCLYEKIREDNIKERMNAMEQSNFFDDLLDMKIKFGFYKKQETNQSKKVSDASDKQMNVKDRTRDDQEGENDTKTTDTESYTRGADE